MNARKNFVAALFATGATAGAYGLHTAAESNNSLPDQDVSAAEATLDSKNLNLALTMSGLPDCQRVAIASTIEIENTFVDDGERLEILDAVCGDRLENVSASAKYSAATQTVAVAQAELDNAVNANEFSFGERALAIGAGAVGGMAAVLVGGVIVFEVSDRIRYRL